MKKYNSHILTVTTESAKRALGINSDFTSGFFPVTGDINKLFKVEDVWVGPRTLLEQDPTFNHVIPYILVRHNNTHLVYQRTKFSGENRLSGNYSIGFGGHIDIGDVISDNGESIDLLGSIIESSARELREELNISFTNIKVKGFILDNTNDVGLVHLGVVLIGNSDITEIESLEDQIDLKGFMTIEEMAGIDNFENWSKILLNEIRDGL